jgi:hypothetical protein
VGFEQFAILANVRRIDPVSFVATQLGTREVPNLGGIDDADDMTSLVQRARDAEDYSARWIPDRREPV